MKKTNKPNPLKVFNDNNAKARMKAGGAMKEFKKSLKKAQFGEQTESQKTPAPSVNDYDKEKVNIELRKMNQMYPQYMMDSEGYIQLAPRKKTDLDKAKNYPSSLKQQKKGGAVKKKMAAGGSSDSDCWPGKPGCGAEKARRVNKRRRFWNSDAGKTVKKVGAGVAAAGAGTAAYLKNAFGVKDAIKGLSEQKKGGSVKRKK